MWNPVLGCCLHLYSCVGRPDRSLRVFGATNRSMECEMTWFYECVGIVVATLLLAGYIIFG